MLVCALHAPWPLFSIFQARPHWRGEGELKDGNMNNEIVEEDGVQGLCREEGKEKLSKRGGVERKWSRLIEGRFIAGEGGWEWRNKQMEAESGSGGRSRD